MTGPELQATLDQVATNEQGIVDEAGYREDGDENLQGQINEIVNGDANVSLTASPTVVFAGENNTIALTATSDTLATAISITGGSLEEPITGTGTSATGEDVINVAEARTITYHATFTIAGLPKTASKNVSVVYPVLFGAGADYTAATAQATPRTSPAGTYNVTVGTAGTYVFFVVPATMAIHGATMSGFEFPLQAAVDVTIGGKAYRSYQSANTYDAGQLTIVLR